MPQDDDGDSANDMAVVLAEGVGGRSKIRGPDDAAAKRLGMTKTNYVNPNGLPADEQITPPATSPSWPAP